MRALPFTGDDDAINTVMAGLVGVLVLVLLVAASNIASLVSARTWSRVSELAVRTAVGAPRSRLVGQLFVEVAILCAMASVLGLVLAQLALDYLAGMITEIPFWMTFHPTIRTMAFVVALAVLAPPTLVPLVVPSPADVTELADAAVAESLVPIPTFAALFDEVASLPPLSEHAASDRAPNTRSEKL